MSHVFPRHTKATYPIAEKGDGCYIIDRDGKKYFDGSGGAAVSCLGHSDPDVTNAIKTQVDRLAFAHTGFFSTEPAEELADLLIAHAPGGLDRVYFVSGGSEAMEAALKLARQYFLEKGETSRHRVIARRQSYHGNTLGALATGGNQWRREPFSPLMIDTTHISPCYEYRGRLEGETAFDYGQRIANELETEIQRLGPENVMAFVAEPVVGATAGAVPPVDGYFKRIREICDQYGILLILDEVMCGMGRTGTLFACDQDGIAPDILCIAKGLGAGYQPIGAMLCTSQIYGAIESGSGFFQHGHTYIGHPVACAASLAVLKKLTGGVADQVEPLGVKLQAALQDAFGQHAHVGDIRGRGLFRGIELVEDRGSKTPFDPKRGLHKAVKKAAFEAGLICYPMGGTIDGVTGDHILVAPPFIMNDTQIGEVVSKLDQALTAAL
ncbi:aspartate aminotransferase family protein [Roseibium denhamense]|uniref:Adenosylmethionine-8-amino-7-oxononanoate aminotransferase n=1 Tax=Roseibium denhamense TaxID=76305 RepID=A0ABY1PC90_9HYPH|nr:aspartate aminotransferase family protein [Roseibium denhamense]MTI04566.1 aspartate aminotransferase family protein [Roseibium denhamense]SMP31273.1 Adenosylmethionine-8-amino-7-oxononanoate aminotransferase [Roseibium denhamense]